MATPAFNDAAKKIQDEERAADEARAADVEAKARAEMSARRGQLDAKYAEQDPKGARMDALRPVVGDPSGKTPAQADELAILRASPEYTRAHRNYLERARNGEYLIGESDADGYITPERFANIRGMKDLTAEQDRNDTRTWDPMILTVSEELKEGSSSQQRAGGFSGGLKDRAVARVDNLARREAIEAYQQERARAKRQSEK